MQRLAGLSVVRRKAWGMPALILALTLAGYAPALRGGLLWDDQAHVTRSDLRGASGLVRIWIDPKATQQYYPVLHTAFWLEHRLWGDATIGYHLMNVALHALSCCLLALVLSRLWPEHPAPWLAAAVFAVHPICVESVAWISEQKNTLSLVFYLSAAFVYLSFDAGRRLRSYALATALFLLALLSKSVTATLPAAILLAIWWRDGALSVRRHVRPLVPWFVVAVAGGLVTAFVERKLIGAEGGSFDLDAMHRVLLAGRVVWFYLGKLVWPVDLMFIYPRWDVGAAASTWIGYLVLALAVTVALWLLRRRSRGPLAGWLFFVGSLLPTLGFFNVYPFLYSYVADHFQYLASLGIIATAAGGAGALLVRASPQVRTTGWALSVLLVAVLLVLTNRQSRMYADGEQLYRATLARNPSCWLAHNNLGVLLVKSPEGTDEAVAHYREALRLRPDFAEAHNNLAIELAKSPEGAADAVAHYDQALRLRPDDAEAHYNLARLFATFPDRMPDALVHYERSVAIKPDVAVVQYGLANALARSPGRLSEAVDHYERTLRIDPGYFQARVNLANALAHLPGRQNEALERYEEALRQRPEVPEVHQNLAVLLSTMDGREADAMAHFQAALRAKPDYVQAHKGLATVYARLGRLAEARAEWERVLALDPGDESARRNIGIVERR